MLPNSFFTSIDLSNHPILNLKDKTRSMYYNALKYMAFNVCSNDCTKHNLEIYSIWLHVEDKKIDNIDNKDIKYFLKSTFLPWKKKYRLLFFYDLILINAPQKNELRNFITNLDDCCSPFLLSFQTKSIISYFNKLYLTILNRNAPKAYGDNLFYQVTNNLDYFDKKQKKIIFTANMSSGKSTVINALVGKKITKTAQEACTGNICYIYQNSFNDGRIHVSKPEFNFNAQTQDLLHNDWLSEIYYSTDFRIMNEINYNICCIDTPGVNSSMNPEHRKLTLAALKNASYDIIVYILSANSLGTEEEIRHLKWIKENMSNKNIVFVLNKLDTFNAQEDSVEESINNVRTDLLNIGFEKPVICPISAYFAFLLKRKYGGEELNDDELDEIELYCKKFKKPQYDISSYYKSCQENKNDTFEAAMLKKCGFYGFENIILGGSL